MPSDKSNGSLLEDRLKKAMEREADLSKSLSYRSSTLGRAELIAIAIIIAAIAFLLFYLAINFLLFAILWLLGISPIHEYIMWFLGVVDPYVRVVLFIISIVSGWFWGENLEEDLSRELKKQKNQVRAAERKFVTAKNKNSTAPTELVNRNELNFSANRDLHDSTSDHLIVSSFFTSITTFLLSIYYGYISLSLIPSIIIYIFWWVAHLASIIVFFKILSLIQSISHKSAEYPWTKAIASGVVSGLIVLVIQKVIFD